MFDTDSTTRPDRLEDWLSLTAFQRDVLVTLALLEDDQDTLCDSTIRKTLEKESGEVTMSRLYTAFDALTDRDLIWKTDAPASDRPNQYYTTAAATDVLRWYSHRLDAELDPTGGVRL